MLNDFKFSYVNIDQEELTNELKAKGKYYANVVHWTLMFSLPIFWLLDYIFLPSDWTSLLFIRLTVAILTYAVYLFGNKTKWPYYKTASVFGGLNVLLSAGICAIVSTNHMLPYFLLFSIVMLLFNITILWRPIYSFIQFSIAIIGLIVFFEIFNKYDGYDSLVANGGGAFFVISLFSCLIAYNRYELFKRETARSILIEEANNRLLEQSEKIVDQHSAIEGFNKKIQKLSDYRYSTLNIILHDFRNFTGSIQMSLDMLKNTNGNLTDEQKEILTYIGVGNDKLKYLSDKLANSAESDTKIAYEFEKVNLGAIAENATLTLNDAAQMKQIKMLLNIDPTPLLIDADKMFLEQIVNKLFANVIRYAQTNSMLAIYTHKRDNKAILEITNKGKLIGKEKLDQLFNNLETINQSSQTATQSALGFSVVKKLTEQMGGKITYNSDESIGNFYRLEFNLTQ
ncbi:MAG: HAMP domain-containing histidine kinase [Deinococcales bacterium]|nr:HAMP domain-containing histidine kinase [Chitinophagaceae bacterium]